ncbi:MAG: glycosyltransferase family 4 protein, partial [Candidatus Nanohaloarchaea archaeon]
IVYTAHGSAVGRFNKIGPNRLKSKIKPWFRIQEEKFINKKADKVVACSNIVKKELLEAYDIDESKVEVIENGVDTDKFSPISKSKAAQELNISSEQKYVCWLGRNPKLKGLDKAENAVKSLDGYKLLIAGVEGQDTSNKKFLGKIDPEKVPRVYSVSDALILPSMYEGFPIVVLEALSTGIPVVASDNVPNFSEYVENVSNEDYDKALRNILRKDVSSEEIREFTKQKYSWERKAEEYNEIYRELL